jgi:aspartate carbamoyltransferase catalytic subunit
MVRRASSDLYALLSIDDLTLEEVAEVLRIARAFGAQGNLARREPFSIGLLFLEPSLRTRAGFAVAAARLGGTPIDVHELRWGPAMSATESFTDTIRTLTGMVDIAVVRTPFRVDRKAVGEAAIAPYVNAGDGNGDHPTQTLIDLLAIEERGSILDLRIGLCGDLRMRAARSLLKLLNRVPPKRLVLMAPEGRDDPGLELAPALLSRTVKHDHADFRDIDVLYMVGLPAGEDEQRLHAEARASFALTAQRLRELSSESIVLSPMPVIDEIAPDARTDPRLRMFAQSDRGVDVRMAVLSWLLETSV